MAQKRARTHQPPFEPRPLEPYRILREHSLSTISLIAWHFNSILKSIYRKISLKQSFRDPFTVKLTEIIFKDTFYQAFRAIRDFQPSDGVSTKTGKKRRRFRFTNLEALVQHPTKLTCTSKEDGGKVVIEKVYIRKRFAHGQNGKIVVSIDDPATFHYKVSMSTLTVSIKYQMTNQFGTVCSY